jgi:SAM-dependent methyltransferase
MMDRSTFRWLLSDEGQRALAEAAALPLTDAAQLADLASLRRGYPPERAAAALETARLRRLAAGKFALAGQMYFTREALEQAGHETVAAHIATRFAGYATIADLGCGIGGDTLALARVARVVAVDRDPLRLAMARANLAAHGLAGRVRLICADLATLPLPPVEALFVDPARRAGGRRRFRLADYEPGYDLIAGWARRVPAVGVKVAPGIADEEAPPDAEVEFVALGGELKAALLWLGPLRTAARRATLLPAGISLAGDGPPAPIRQGEPAGYLCEPNPAVIRAHLLDQLAARLEAWQLDPTIAYLCAAVPAPAPLARSYPVEAWFPFNLKELRRQLRQRGVGRVTVKKRGSPLDPAALARQLRLAGPNRRVVVLTRVAGRPVVVVCHEPAGQPAEAAPV